MTRVKGGPRGHRQHTKIKKLAKGYRGARHRLFRKSNEAVTRAGAHAFAGRKIRRRDMRKLWITRINGGLKELNSEYNYSRFIQALKKANIDLNRKSISEMAINNSKAFGQLIKTLTSSK